MAKVKVRLKSAGMVELLKSKGVAAELEGRMRRVAAAYGPGEVRVEARRDRNVVRVYSTKKNSFYREAKTGALARAFSASGGA